MKKKAHAGSQQSRHATLDPLHSIDSASQMTTIYREHLSEINLCEELCGLRNRKLRIPQNLSEFK